MEQNFFNYVHKKDNFVIQTKLFDSGTAETSAFTSLEYKSLFLICVCWGS